MPPKKAAVQKKVETVSCGLALETALPVWDDVDIDKENWGDMAIVPHSAEPTSLFVDPEHTTPQPSAAFAPFVSEWKRPFAIFSPFKPMVCRATVSVNPYEYDPEKAPLTEEDDEGNKVTLSKAEVVQNYRTMRPFRSCGEEDSSKHGRRTNVNSSGKRKDRTHTPTPPLMRAFNSALMVLSQSQGFIPSGSYAWELIYPQQAGLPYPAYNPYGKYAVKLFFNGAFRKVIIDDRLPTDIFGQSILTVTEHKEVWPALLVKAMLKVLGPAHEDIIFKYPVWTVATLLCGWVPQIISPIRDELLCLHILRQSVKKPTDDQPKENVVICATCGEGASLECVLPQSEEYYTQQGLIPNQVYCVMDIRRYQNTSLVRLASPNTQWSGPFAYDSNTWTAEVESQIEFDAKTDRDSGDVLKRWNDFWIPWESFIKYFHSLIAYRNVLDKKFSFYKQISGQPDPPPPDVNVKGGKAVQPPPVAVEKLPPRSCVKWIHCNSEVDTHALVSLIGLAKPRVHDEPDALSTPSKTTSLSVSPEKADLEIPSPPESPRSNNKVATITVHRYEWTSSAPLRILSSIQVPWSVTQATRIVVPAGVQVFRIAVSNLPPDCAVSVMGSSEITIGDEREICRDLLGVCTLSDAGVFGEHQPGNTAVWFKRLFTVKAPTTCNISLQTLPKGTDLTQFRQIPVEATQAHGKGKPPAKAAGKPAANQTNVNLDQTVDVIDDAPHAVPIITCATLVVIDLDTNVQYKDTVGKINNLTLQPNKNGFLVMAHATTDEAYGKGYWHLQCLTDQPFDKFEPRTFDETIAKSGEYLHNEGSVLFRYNISVGEAAAVSAFVSIDAPYVIPFKLSLLQNDKEMEVRSCESRGFIEHMALAPPEKGSTTTYALQCVLDAEFTAYLHQCLKKDVADLFRADSHAQSEFFRGLQQRARNELSENPNAQIAHDEGKPEPSAPPTSKVFFNVTMFSQSSKVELKEDPSVHEAANAIKASWQKKEREGTAPEPVQKGKGGKGGNTAAQDEAALRFQRGKEARERFLNNRQNVFIPYNNGTKVLLNPEDDASFRQVPAKPVGVIDFPNRQHGGVVKGGILNDGTRGVPPRDDVRIPPSPPLTKFQEDTLQRLAATRDCRKQNTTTMQEALATFWAEQRPDRASEATAEETQKAKAPAKGKK